MSGLFSSFLIDPVVRQASRFSSGGRPGHENVSTWRLSMSGYQGQDNAGRRKSASLELLKDELPGKQEDKAKSHVNIEVGAPLDSSSSLLTVGDNTADRDGLLSPATSCCIRMPDSDNGANAPTGPPLTLQHDVLALTLDPTVSRQAIVEQTNALVSNQESSSVSLTISLPQMTPSHFQTDEVCQLDSQSSSVGSQHAIRSSDVMSIHNVSSPGSDVIHVPSSIQMDRRSIRGLCPPGLDITTREAIEEEMTRRIHHTSVLSRGGEVRRRRESARQTAEALADAMKDKGNVVVIQDEAEIRRKIQTIWAQPISTQEKSRAMHLVMNEKYLAHVEEKQRERAWQTDAPAKNHHGLNCSSSLDPLQSTLLYSADRELYTRYNILLHDLVPTYRSGNTGERRPSVQRRSSSSLACLAITSSLAPLSRVDDEDYESDADNQPNIGCEHYKRNIKIQCFDCKTWWNCRHCHDSAETGHILAHQSTEYMLCMLCQTPGPAGQYCQHCGEQAAYYYCDICKLWDDDTVKDIYHCADCGICRVGLGLGKDFRHCKRCNVCMPITKYDWHKCIERATECDCPICGDYLFTSVTPIVSMPCGHYIHQSCYNQYMLDAYQCPVCKKSAKNMASQWRKLEEEIARQPMPTNLQNISVDVRCNDCAGRSRVPFHWLGNKCELCDSYNTVEIQLHRHIHGPTNSSTPPRGNWRSGRSIPRARVRRYFQDDDEDEENRQSRATTSIPTAVSETSTADHLFALPNTAYEILSNQFAAVRRNLSPITRYLNAVEDSPNAATEAEIEQMGFWQYGASPSTHPIQPNTLTEPDAADDWEDEDDDDNDNDNDNDNDDDDDDDDDDDASSLDSGGLVLDDDSDSSDDDLDIRLIGHR